MNKTMRTKILIFLSIIFLTVPASCKKVPEYYLYGNESTFIGDKDKIDVKGSLSNGDMKGSKLSVYYIGKTIYVYFHDYLEMCTVTITNSRDYKVFEEKLYAYPNAEVRCFMGDFSRDRYHITISDGTEEAEGWFNNYRIVMTRL